MFEGDANPKHRRLPPQRRCPAGDLGRFALPAHSSSTSELDDAATNCDRNRLSAITGAQLLHDVLHMDLYRFF